MLYINYIKRRSSYMWRNCNSFFLFYATKLLFFGLTMRVKNIKYTYKSKIYQAIMAVINVQAGPNLWPRTTCNFCSANSLQWIVKGVLISYNITPAPMSSSSPVAYSQSLTIVFLRARSHQWLRQNAAAGVLQDDSNVDALIATHNTIYCVFLNKL